MRGTIATLKVSSLYAFTELFYERAETDLCAHQTVHLMVMGQVFMTFWGTRVTSSTRGNYCGCSMCLFLVHSSALQHVQDVIYSNVEGAHVLVRTG